MTSIPHFQFNLPFPPQSPLNCCLKLLNEFSNIALLQMGILTFSKYRLKMKDVGLLL